MTSPIPAVVLGATGYVGGELLRLIAGHPQLELAAAVSGSSAGQPVCASFGHLAPVLGESTFEDPDHWFDRLPQCDRLAVFSAAPHGASAGLIKAVLDRVASEGIETHVVDASADFRFADETSYASVYGAHGAPSMLGSFASGLPEHVAGIPAAHVGNPGCFATALLLAIVPLLAADLTTACFAASGITGSTGSGKSPVPTTHHPERHSNLYAYKPLEHRHAPEVLHLARAATGKEAMLSFVPHSGPFARGIHMTVFAQATQALTAAELRDVLNDAYAEQPFVRVVAGMPRLKDVVASNYALLGAAADGDQLVVTVVIDNLVKGAAGGAVQWMNRLLGFRESAGLDVTAPAWT